MEISGKWWKDEFRENMFASDFLRLFSRRSVGETVKQSTCFLENRKLNLSSCQTILKIAKF
jgi:hypothetical protein